jgi:hypothetical protein
VKELLLFEGEEGRKEEENYDRTGKRWIKVPKKEEE